MKLVKCSICGRSHFKAFDVSMNLDNEFSKRFSKTPISASIGYELCSDCGYFLMMCILLRQRKVADSNAV